MIGYITRAEKECKLAVILNALLKTGETQLERLKTSGCGSCKTLGSRDRTRLETLVDRVARVKCLCRARRHCDILGLNSVSPLESRGARIVVHACRRGRPSGGGGSRGSIEGHDASTLATTNCSLFRTLQGLHLRVTGRRTVPPCVIFDSGALVSVYVGYPSGRRRVLRISNINRGGLGGCNREFLRRVRGFYLRHPGTILDVSRSRGNGP